MVKLFLKSECQVLPLQSPEKGETIWFFVCNQRGLWSEVMEKLQKSREGEANMLKKRGRNVT